MVVEAAPRTAASPGAWDVLPPVSIDGLATAVPANPVSGSDVLRLITQLWPRLERRVSLFADELAET